MRLQVMNIPEHGTKPLQNIPPLLSATMFPGISPAFRVEPVGTVQLLKTIPFPYSADKSTLFAY